MKNYVALLLACTGLAACGGGGGGGGSTVAPVASAPAPTTNTTMTNLVASQSFPSVGTSINAVVAANGQPTQISLVTASADVVGVSYNAGNQSYTVTANIGSQTFAASDRNAAESTNLVTVYTKTAGGVEDELVMANGAAGGFTYTNFASWSRASTSGTSAPVHGSYVVYGIPTTAADMARTGTATYAISGGGVQLNNIGLRPLNGTGSLTANFATSTLQTNLNLGGFGTLTGSAAINSSNATFSGAMSGVGYSGTLAGRFFGPAAAEVGGAFSMTGPGGFIDGFLIGRK